jgi:hypothetical protein
VAVTCSFLADAGRFLVCSALSRNRRAGAAGSMNPAPISLAVRPSGSYAGDVGINVIAPGRGLRKGLVRSARISHLDGSFAELA